MNRISLVRPLVSKRSVKNANLLPGAWRLPNEKSVLLNVDGSWANSRSEASSQDAHRVIIDRFVKKVQAALTAMVETLHLHEAPLHLSEASCSELKEMRSDLKRKFGDLRGLIH
ncbi:hypothetical protein ACJRO7_017114 [Eucalyptus globulus]|uniref:Uncharacterized protein n=1 Tax=Eucalyptus globulus TaxID=34317 RepID=A0ABD3KW93_EUCGL